MWGCLLEYIWLSKESCFEFSTDEPVHKFPEVEICAGMIILGTIGTPCPNFSPLVMGLMGCVSIPKLKKDPCLGKLLCFKILAGKQYLYLRPTITFVVVLI